MIDLHIHVTIDIVYSMTMFKATVGWRRGGLPEEEKKEYTALGPTCTNSRGRNGDEHSNRNP